MEKVLAKIRELIDSLPPEERATVAMQLYHQYSRGKRLFVTTPDNETIEFHSLEMCRRYFASMGYTCDRAAISKTISRNGRMYGYEIYRLDDSELQDDVEEASVVVDTDSQDEIE